MQKKLLCFILVVLFVTASVSLPVFARKRQILCIGESLTCGSGSTWNAPITTITTGNTYPGRVDTLLGSSVEVFNCGVSGIAVLPEPTFEFAKNGYLYCVRHFSDPSDTRNPFREEYAPDDIFVFLGTNDCKPRVWEIESGGEDNFYADYTEIIEELKAIETHPNVYCMIPPPVIDDDPDRTNYTMVESILRDEISPIIRRVANEQQCRVVDLRALFENYSGSLEDLYFTGDGAHPNPTGYDLIAREMIRVLRITPGDVNKTGSVNEVDVLDLAKHISGWDVTFDPEAADVNLDGAVDLADLTRLAKHITGWDLPLLPAPRDLS